MNLLLLISFFVWSVGASLLERLQSLDTRFLQEGPTSAMLNEYDQVVKEIENTELPRSIMERVPQVYFKKGLIELNFNKESQAIADFKKSLKLDGTMKPVKEKLLQLLFERGDFEEIEELLKSSKDEGGDYAAKIADIKKNLAIIEKLFASGKFNQCVSELDKTVLNASPSNTKALDLHLKSLLGIYKMEVGKDEPKFEGDNVNKLIIKDIQKLLKIQPLANLQLYQEIAQFLIFTETQVEPAKQILKNCLRIDNENAGCGKLSKFLTKFSPFLKILEDYSTMISHYYTTFENQHKGNLDDEFKNPNIDWNYVNDFLFTQDIKVSKIEKNKLPKQVKTNYDYLTFQAGAFLKQVAGKEVAEKTKFVKELNMLVCQTGVEIKDKEAFKFCAKTEDYFLPKSIPEVDKLLKKHKYAEAQQILTKFSPNVQQTKLFRDRYEKIEAEEARQHQKQQQYRQQQQQQHQRQQQQRQQQARKPSVDYYKVLGISRDADEKTIKKAHRAQTLKFHPDKYKGTDLSAEQIENKMQEINQAYEVLSNPESRAMYDRGDDPNDPRGGQGGQGGQGGGPEFNADFMNQFFQGAGGGQGGFRFTSNQGFNFGKKKRRGGF